MKELVVILFILFLPAGIFSQDISGLREKIIIADNDTIRLDSLRIVPGTIEISHPKDSMLNDSLYQTDALKSLLILNSDFPYYNEDIYVKYRVFTSDPGLGSSRKDETLMIPYQKDEGAVDPYRYSYRPLSDDIWSKETLVRSGSISRGVSFGNNQDVIVNSNLNLQLSGKLDDNLNIIASISDQNIPLQPEGYSQQIHEFDKIFIQVFNDNLSLTAGDFEVKGGGGKFLPIDKKAQGVQFTAVVEPGSGPFNSLRNTASAAIAKGRYHRNSLNGIEGNQGPYKLRGANNELFIIILAGTERVFIDGRLLSRGVDRDYTIDYNLAEITFTSGMPITKDRRIIVEFEYSDRNYTKFMISNTTEISTNKGNYFVNVFSEHDARNQPLMQELKDEEKNLLSNIGDSLHHAWVPKIDSVEFRNDIVLYEKTDTITDGIAYEIYRFSVNPDRAHYRLGFSYVGENMGNYKPVKNAANGRVFQWVAPVNGIPAGTHEPVRLLVTPKKHQVVSMGGNSNVTDNTKANFELAISNFDKNTFSGLDNKDNRGLAFRIGLNNRLPLSEVGHNLDSGFDYEYSGKQFVTVERFRPVEFSRDWNLENIEEKSDEHILSWYATYNGRVGDFASYKGEHLRLPGNYSGLRNKLEANTKAAGFDNRVMLSYLSSGNDVFGSGFLRYSAEISRPLWFFSLGVRTEGENNRLEVKPGKILSASSFAYDQREIFIRNQDTSKFHFFTSYRLRDDKIAQENKLTPSSSAREISSGFKTSTTRGNQFSGTINHRRLKPDKITENYVTPENSLNGRLESRLRLLNGSVQGSGFFETGSGLETKRDFMYIEVARGQGTHTWTDYNDNGIKELDEFETAVFPDQANYIRIFIPGDDFIPTRSNQFSQSIRINPPPAWHNSDGLKKIFSFFSSQTAFRTGHKTRRTDLLAAINPFFSNLADTNLINISSSLRNTIYFQPANRRFRMEYLHQDNKSKNLLVNGFDIRNMRSDAIHTRFEVSPTVELTNQMETGTRSYKSDFFPGRDFDIDMFSSKMGVSFQPGYSLQTSLHMKWTRQKNQPGKEKSEQHNLGSELNYTIPSKGNILVRIDYYYISYNANRNTPLAWEILEGLKTGNNMTLMLQFQQNITGNLQMSINYNGRTAQGERFIHTGGVQMRAYF